MQEEVIQRWVLAVAVLLVVLGVGFVGYSIAGFVDPTDYPGETANLLLIAAAGAFEIVGAVWLWRAAPRKSRPSRLDLRRRP